MGKQFFAAAAIALFAAGPVFPQEVAAPTATISTCDQWGLSAKDLTECRKQWRAAKSDVERQRIKTDYQNRSAWSGTPSGRVAPASQRNGPSPAGKPLTPTDEQPGVQTTPPISGLPPAAPRQ
jgi:hypothetical protein